MSAKNMYIHWGLAATRGTAITNERAVNTVGQCWHRLCVPPFLVISETLYCLSCQFSEADRQQTDCELSTCLLAGCCWAALAYTTTITLKQNTSETWAVCYKWYKQLKTYSQPGMLSVVRYTLNVCLVHAHLYTKTTSWVRFPQVILV